MAITNEQKTRELALEMGEEGSLMYSHAMSILTKMAAWKEQQMIDWLKNKAANYVVCDEAEFSHYATKSMIEDLKKAMEE